MDSYYNKDYFMWQRKAGEFGGWANLSKFEQYISPKNTVLDFGCGGGYLLKNINCKEKIGVEINPSAALIAENNEIRTFPTTDDVKDSSVDVIISDNALEHTFRPLDELVKLNKKLKIGGKIVVVVPCESINMKYESKNINQHLYCWSPMALGNLLNQAGFELIESKKYIHKWPPKSRFYAKLIGRTLFDILSKMYGRIDTTWFQVRAVATKK